MARNISAFLNYVHLDAALAGLALVFFIGAGVANNIGAFRSISPSIPSFSVSAATPSQPPEAERATPTLTPPMKAALDYVVQRYRVSAEALLPVFEAAQSIGPKHHLDPLLLIAVISVESRFNPFSQSPVGAQGLMQIIPRYHQDKVASTAAEKPFLDPITNVSIGAQILQESIRRQGGLIEGLQYYAGALDDDEQAYANKVLAEKLRLEQAPRRKGAIG
ncbi:MAG: transglycosylase SLT domain-containing protein [Sulfuritalea sp.]|jgi:soluble lytic murein transglycosylase-like protein|nr:transglycosylase SLT domain-containing protein [Sulfuritalea sp.]